jgi:hypothetical protein
LIQKNKNLPACSETSLDTVKTLLAYGYIIEPPVQDNEEGNKKSKAGNLNVSFQEFIFI